MDQGSSALLEFMTLTCCAAAYLLAMGAQGGQGIMQLHKLHLAVWRQLHGGLHSALESVHSWIFSQTSCITLASQHCFDTELSAHDIMCTHMLALSR